MFGHRWEPATGILIDTRYGGKHGDWSGNRMECMPSKRKAKFDRHDPTISKKAREAAGRATYEAELQGGPDRREAPRA